MNSSDSVLDKLDELLARVEDEVHELEIADADVLEDSAWYKSCRQTRQALLKAAAQTSLYSRPRSSGPHLHRIEVGDAATVKAARELAYTPLHVLVENFSSDGALLKFAIKLLATPATHRLCFGDSAAATPPPIQFESPGGHGDLPKLLEKRVQEAKTRGIRARVVVVTDSDSEWADDVKPHANEIRERCASVDVQCPPLRKRTAENYIPDGIWRAWAADHPKARLAIDALLRLSSDQRDYVRIDKTNAPPWDSAKEPVRALFAKVSEEDEAAIAAASLKGRGTTAISYILDTYSSSSSEADLLARDTRGDLRTVVECIKDEL